MEIEDFIFEDFIDHIICDDLITFFENSPNKINGRIGSDDKEKKHLKECKELFLKLEDKVCESYLKELSVVINKYKEKYKYSDKLQYEWGIMGIKVQKYDPNQAYHVWHFENEGDERSVRRHLVFMTYLNDVGSGGETGFLYQNKTIKPKKGKTIIWPAIWTHTHKGFIAPSSTKYICTGWYGYCK